jgi:hemolysin D
MFQDSHEFKPILTEIEEAPVNPLGRFTFWLLVVIVSSVLLWLTIGEVDVVATGRGKVTPEGQVKVLQPLDTGVVTAIRVKEGDYVKKGQVLLEIDPSLTEPLLTSSQQTLDYSDLESQRIRAMLEDRPFSPSYSQYEPDAIDTQMTLYNAGMHGFQSQLQAKEQEHSQLKAQLAALKDMQKRTNEMTSISETQYNRLLPVKDLITKQEFESAEKDLLTLKHQQKEVNFKLQEMQHRIDQLQSEKRLLVQNFKGTLLNELSQRERARIEIKAKTKEMGFHHGKQQIVSPTNGVVDQIFIHTLGGVVTPAEKLLTVVPSESKLLIEAQFDNRDIGFIHKNQETMLKVDTFDFQRYGTLPGVVSKVSSDSHAVDETNKGAPVYTVTIDPLKSSLMVHGKNSSIRSGMTVTVEIKLAKRRIIEFFLDPLIKSLDESFKLR